MRRLREKRAELSSMKGTFAASATINGKLLGTTCKES